MGAACFAAYLTLLSAVPGDKDSGEFTLVLATGGLAHPTGYALYTLVGSAFVHALHALGASWSVAANAFSALGAGVAMGGLHALTARLLRRLSAAILSPMFALLPILAFALNPMWTQEATLAEVNSWHLAWVMLAALVALSLSDALSDETRAGVPATRIALIWGAVAGLGIAHHATSVLFSLPLSLALLMVAAQQRRLTAPAVLALAGGAIAPLASASYVAYRAWHPSRAQWPELEPNAASVLAHLSGSQFRAFLGHFSPSPTHAALLARWIYPWLVPALAGAAAAWRPPASGRTVVRHALGAAVVLQCGYAFLYGVADPGAYFLPVLAIGLALGVEALASRSVVRRHQGMLAPGLMVLLMVLAIPGRDATRARNTAFAQLDDLVRRMWAAVPPGPAFVVWDDDMASRLRTLQTLEHNRTDIEVIQPRHLSHAAPRARFMATHGFDPLASVPAMAQGPAPADEAAARQGVEAIEATINARSPLPVYLFRPELPSLRLLQKNAADSMGVIR